VPGCECAGIVTEVGIHSGEVRPAPCPRPTEGRLELLSIRGLRSAHGGPFDLDLPRGECASIVGPSGVGKSLFLRLVADLDPGTGSVTLDGRSRDATAENARKAGARVFADSGLGKGSAIRESLSHSQADVIVFMDADGSHDPADIPRLAGVILSGEADLCVGCRFSGGSEELSVSTGQLIRTVGNIAMNIAINRRWNVQLSDTLNGFRAVRRSAALQVELTEDRHTIEQEMVMKFLRNGYRVVNIPAHEYPREFGTSHIRIWREWPMFVWCVITNVATRDVSETRALSPTNSISVPPVAEPARTPRPLVR